MWSHVEKVCMRESVHACVLRWSALWVTVGWSSVCAVRPFLFLLILVILWAAGRKMSV